MGCGARAGAVKIDIHMHMHMHSSQLSTLPCTDSDTGFDLLDGTPHRPPTADSVGQ